MDAGSRARRGSDADAFAPEAAPDYRGRAGSMAGGDQGELSAEQTEQFARDIATAKAKREAQATVAAVVTRAGAAVEAAQASHKDALAALETVPKGAVDRDRVEAAIQPVAAALEQAQARG